MLRIINILHYTTVDGPGFRTSIYAAGCRHSCPNCHNPESWPRWAGRDMSIGEVLAEVLAEQFTNITFSGGDPFFQAEDFARLGQEIKSLSNKNIWCYTGFTFEQIYDAVFLHRQINSGSRLTYCNLDAVRQLLETIDVLVDGPFVQSLRNTDLLFRGSSNQRLIDVPQSLLAGKAVPWQRK